MKIIQYFFISSQVILLLLNKTLNASNNNEIKGIAVVKSQFDRIEKVLRVYNIPYTLIQCRDLEKKDIFDNYRSIFFPCGIDCPIETNLNILSRGTSIQAVYFKEDYSEIDKEKICENIQSFITGGGVAYFSGYSYEFLQGAFNVFQFFNNFPNMGMPGRFSIELKDDLKIFCRLNRLRVFMPHSGWIAIKSVKDAEILADGSFETPKGRKSGPIIVNLERGKGKILYTSYHNHASNNNNSRLLRYMVYRVSYMYLLKTLIDKAKKWEQTIQSTLVDSIREWENCRTYRIPFKKGENSLYFTTNSGFFQIDIFDFQKRLVASQDLLESEFFMNINTQIDSFYIIKVYPSNFRKLGTYAILTAKGSRFFPYLNKILTVLFLILVILLIYWIKRLIGPRKFSGRILQK